MGSFARFAPKKQLQRMSSVPSKLITQLVDDLRWVVKSKRVSFYMGDWGACNGKCDVCAAGAMVLRREPDVKKLADSFSYRDMNNKTSELMLAVNELRQGHTSIFLCHCQDAGHKFQNRYDVVGDLPDDWAKDHGPCLFGVPENTKVLEWCNQAVELATYLKSKGH